MQNDYTEARRNIRVMLFPIFDLLVYKQAHLKAEDWLKFVQKTEDSICNNPDQYFGNERPEQEITHLIVRELFLEFTGSRSSAIA